MSKRFGVVWAVMFILGASCSLAAQNSMPQGTIEAAASVGITNGLGSVNQFTNIPGLIGDLANLSGGVVRFDPGSNTKWNVGVSGGYAIKPNFMVVGELVRTRLQNPTLNFNILSVPTSVGFDASLIEATGGVQYQAPLRESRIAPFAGVQVGWADSRLAMQNSTFNVLDLNLSDNHFTVNFGGGARIYFTPSWGLRPEFKIAHIPNETWVRTSVGLFFQFGK
jgi:hypothetical protein